MLKHIILCADDYGQSTEISQGILALLSKERLSAVSCLVNFPNWSSAAPLLQTYSHQADFGLHLNLTEGFALSTAWQKAYGAEFPSLFRLIWGLKRGHIKKSIILAEFLAQWEGYTQNMATNPHFMDGHQHIQQLPEVRDALIDLYKLKANPAVYVRVSCVKPTLDFGFNVYFKQLIINALGVRQFNAQLKQEGILHNQFFSGVYHFKAGAYPRLFPLFLQQIPAKGIIMCHPGHYGKSGSLASIRHEEYKYLMSDQFMQDCKAAGILLSRGKSVFL